MKKGFTLIELLAVIVILAIIALIATPIVLNIINDSKSKANEISAQNYLDAVELEIAKQNLNSEFSPSVCIIEEEGKLLCDGTDSLTVKVDGNVPSSGYVSIKKGKVQSYSLTIDEKLLEDIEESPFIVDAYYSKYGQSGYAPIDPTIENNNLSLDNNIGPGNTFRIDLPIAGYSFDWSANSGLKISFYSYSKPTEPETIWGGGTSNGSYKTKESGYILFEITGGSFSINNLNYNNKAVVFNYTHPTASIDKVAIGCSTTNDQFHSCSDIIENGATVNEPIYIFAYQSSTLRVCIRINDGECKSISYRGSGISITEPGTYKLKAEYRAWAGSIISSPFWPSEEYFTVTITE